MVYGMTYLIIAMIGFFTDVYNVKEDFFDNCLELIGFYEMFLADA